MPETTQSDLVERREALSFNLYLECAGLQNPSECFPVGGDFTSMAELLSVVEQAERDAFEITRLRAHCEAMAKAITAFLPVSVAIDNPTWADGTFIPLDTSLGELRVLKTARDAYRKEGGA